jgi:hypothetical protein
LFFHYRALYIAEAASQFHALDSNEGPLTYCEVFQPIVSSTQNRVHDLNTKLLNKCWSGFQRHPINALHCIERLAALKNTLLRKFLIVRCQIIKQQNGIPASILENDAKILA